MEENEFFISIHHSEEFLFGGVQQKRCGGPALKNLQKTNRRIERNSDVRSDGGKVSELTSPQWCQLRFYFWRYPFLLFYYIAFITVIPYYLKSSYLQSAVCCLLFLFAVCYLQFIIHFLLFADCYLQIISYFYCLLFSNDIEALPERTGALPGFRWLWDEDVCLPSLPGALPVFRLSNWKNGRNLLFTESLAEDEGRRAL